MLAEKPAPPWTARVLKSAAALDVVGGGVLLLVPGSLLSGAGLDASASLEAWRALGLVIALSGLGLALAARSPLRHWPVVLVSLLSKILVPLGFVWAASVGRLPWELGALALPLGPVWWAPFGAILREARRAHHEDTTPPVVPLDMALSLYRDDEGTDLLEASRKQPQFLVFLRHFGCTFCREALSDLSTIKDRLREVGTRLVLVHMSSENEACEMLDSYGLPSVTAISDPDRVLYSAFALRRGTPAQLLGWSVWKRGWHAGVRDGHGIGWLRGDASQMPGAFVVAGGRVVAQFIHETAADRPDYVDLASEGADEVEFRGTLEDDSVGVGFKERLRELLTSDAASRN